MSECQIINEKKRKSPVIQNWKENLTIINIMCNHNYELAKRDLVPKDILLTGYFFSIPYNQL